MNTIWKDPEGKKRKKKMRIRQRDITSSYDTEIFSNCRAVRLKPGQNCRNLAYQDGAVGGTDDALVGDQGIYYYIGNIYRRRSRKKYDTEESVLCYKREKHYHSNLPS